MCPPAAHRGSRSGASLVARSCVCGRVAGRRGRGRGARSEVGRQPRLRDQGCMCAGHLRRAARRGAARRGAARRTVSSVGRGGADSAQLLGEQRAHPPHARRHGAQLALPLREELLVREHRRGEEGAVQRRRRVDGPDHALLHLHGTRRASPTADGQVVCGRDGREGQERERRAEGLRSTRREDAKAEGGTASHPHPHPHPHRTPIAPARARRPPRRRCRTQS